MSAPIQFSLSQRVDVDEARQHALEGDFSEGAALRIITRDGQEAYVAVGAPRSCQTVVDGVVHRLSAETSRYPGLHKVQEEMAEVGEVLAKLCIKPDGDHWVERFEGRCLRSDLEEELGDLTAAMEYLIENAALDRQKIMDRYKTKLERFNQWGMSGPGGQDAVGKGMPA